MPRKLSRGVAIGYNGANSCQTTSNDRPQHSPTAFNFPLVDPSFICQEKILAGLSRQAPDEEKQAL